MKVTLNSFSRIAGSALLASSLSFAVGCSDSSGGDDKPAETSQNGTAVSGTGGDASTGQTGNSSTSTTAPADTGTALSPGGKIDCEAAWKAYVKANPAGLTLAYKITSSTKSSDGSIIESPESSMETTVTASSDVQVSTLTKVSFPGLGIPNNESESVTTKVEFIANCGQVGNIQLGDATATVLEQSAQKITVAAGTFDTNYTKTQVSSTEAGGSSIISAWVLADGSNILVKSEASVEVAALGFTNISTTELVKIVRP